jgi:hypothetical protein
MEEVFRIVPTTTHVRLPHLSRVSKGAHPRSRQPEAFGRDAQTLSASSHQCTTLNVHPSQPPDIDL